MQLCADATDDQVLDAVPIERLDDAGPVECRALDHGEVAYSPAAAVSAASAKVATALPIAVARRKPLTRAVSEALVAAFEVLGPTFVKVGQLITSAPGVFPAPLVDACARCLDEVPPIPTAIVHEIITDDLGQPASRLFRSFKDTPLSAASIAQVHVCVLPDGRAAVVKVQRPRYRPADEHRPAHCWRHDLLTM